MMIYEFTDKEIEKFIEGYVESDQPLKFREIPAKEKRKYLMLCMVIHAIDEGSDYTEISLNALLKPIVNDYAMIRRYLVDYGFLDRKTDGSAYWLIKDHQAYKRYHIDQWIKKKSG